MGFVCYGPSIELSAAVNFLSCNARPCANPSHTHSLQQQAWSLVQTLQGLHFYTVIPYTAATAVIVSVYWLFILCPVITSFQPCHQESSAFVNSEAIQLGHQLTYLFTWQLHNMLFSSSSC